MGLNPAYLILPSVVFWGVVEDEGWHGIAGSLILLLRFLRERGGGGGGGLGIVLW